MLEQELKDIWRNATPLERVKFDLSRLLIELNHKMEHIERSIRARDKRETIAAILGMLIFGYFAYEIPFPITKIACVLAVGIMAYIIYRLRSVRKDITTVDLALPFRDQLSAQKTFLLKQKNLLDTVLYWYVLPPFLMNILFIVGLGDPAAYDWSPPLLDLLPIAKQEKISTIIGLAVFYGIVVWINRRTARTYYGPVIQNIERVQEELEAKN